ncbi:hypothetical protein BEWA_039710 [Theileria equi strain WA]|uniref:Uncharacterized protein n=1 Tax=Theileria equi strain WA TaxID=1537102 RepID=L1LFK2_THEEQ|nr:hypothetical protein BEWA_039710 [Theileria equi strain WA]EKX73933.1 hypothetical protein BEWA_039710 [Theileria equi strain WA]|eukprot:XP_004833385.1 hypothetical protein BEWA_039710 [Theileria equi strain WA]
MTTEDDNILQLLIGNKCGSAGTACSCPGGTSISEIEAKREDNIDNFTGFVALIHSPKAGLTFTLRRELDGNESLEDNQDIHGVTKVSVYYWTCDKGYTKPLLLEIIKNDIVERDYYYKSEDGEGDTNTHIWKRDTNPRGTALQAILDDRNCVVNNAVPFFIDEPEKGIDTTSDCAKKKRIEPVGGGLQLSGSDYRVTEYKITGLQTGISRVQYQKEKVSGIEIPSGNQVSQIRLYSSPVNDKIPLMININLKTEGYRWYYSTSANGQNWGEHGGIRLYNNSGQPTEALAKKLDCFACEYHNGVTIDLSHRTSKAQNNYCCSEHKDGKKVSVTPHEVRCQLHSNSSYITVYKHSIRESNFKLGSIKFYDNEQNKRRHVRSRNLKLPIEGQVEVYIFYCTDNNPVLVYVDATKSTKSQDNTGWYRKSKGGGYSKNWSKIPTGIGGITHSDLDRDLIDCTRRNKLVGVLKKLGCTTLSPCPKSSSPERSDADDGVQEEDIPLGESEGEDESYKVLDLVNEPLSEVEAEKDKKNEKEDPPSSRLDAAGPTKEQRGKDKDTPVAKSEPEDSLQSDGKFRKSAAPGEGLGSIPQPAVGKDGTKGDPVKKLLDGLLYLGLGVAGRALGPDTNNMFQEVFRVLSLSEHGKRSATGPDGKPAIHTTPDQGSGSAPHSEPNTGSSEQGTTQVETAPRLPDHQLGQETPESQTAGGNSHTLTSNAWGDSRSSIPASSLKSDPEPKGKTALYKSSSVNGNQDGVTIQLDRTYYEGLNSLQSIEISPYHDTPVKGYNAYEHTHYGGVFTINKIMNGKYKASFPQETMPIRDVERLIVYLSQCDHKSLLVYVGSNDKSGKGHKWYKNKGHDTWIDASSSLKKSPKQAYTDGSLRTTLKTIGQKLGISCGGKSKRLMINSESSNDLPETNELPNNYPGSFQQLTNHQSNVVPGALKYQTAKTAVSSPYEKLQETVGDVTPPVYVHNQGGCAGGDDNYEESSPEKKFGGNTDITNQKADHPTSVTNDGTPVSSPLSAPSIAEPTSSHSPQDDRTAHSEGIGGGTRGSHTAASLHGGETGERDPAPLEQKDDSITQGGVTPSVGLGGQVDRGPDGSGGGEAKSTGGQESNRAATHPQGHTAAAPTQAASQESSTRGPPADSLSSQTGNGADAQSPTREAGTTTLPTAPHSNEVNSLTPASGTTSQGEAAGTEKFVLTTPAVATSLWLTFGSSSATLTGAGGLTGFGWWAFKRSKGDPWVRQI